MGLTKGKIYWGHSSDQHGPYRGTFASREAAVAEGRIEHAGEPFYVCGGPAIDPCLIDADDVFELLRERARETAGDSTDEPIVIVGNGPSLLIELLDAWCEQHVEVNAWRADREPDLIEPTTGPVEIDQAADPTRENTPTVVGAREAAALLGIHHTTLYDAAKRGEIPCRRIGRRFLFVREALVDWLLSQ